MHGKFLIVRRDQSRNGNENVFFFRIHNLFEHSYVSLEVRGSHESLSSERRPRSRCVSEDLTKTCVSEFDDWRKNINYILSVFFQPCHKNIISVINVLHSNNFSTRAIFSNF